MIAINSGILADIYYKNGFDSTIQSNIPIQAGTSSSSSIVVGWIKLISSPPMSKLLKSLLKKVG